MSIAPHPTDPDKFIVKKSEYYNFGWEINDEQKDLEEQLKLKRLEDEKRFDRLERTIILLPMIIYVFTFINTLVFLYWIAK